MRRWNHNVILFRGIARFLSAVWMRWFPGQLGDRTCLVFYKRLVICIVRPFQLLPSVCPSNIPLTLSWKFFPPPPRSPTGCHRLHLLKDGPLETLWGGGGREFSSRRNLFSLSNSLYEFFGAIAWIFFRINWRTWIFFSFYFPLREYFFCTSPTRPLPPHKFSNGPSLIVLSSLVCRKYLLICGGFLSPPFLKRC